MFIKKLSFATSLIPLIALFYAGTAPSYAIAGDKFENRLPEDEITYFLLPDRFENGDKANDKGGLIGDRLVTGFDPTSKGFYHGGDVKGLMNRLDYIKGLGATAIWVAPIFKNKPVQGPKGDESAGYHGYWITDFTTIDPHYGTEAEYKQLIEKAHNMGLKVYMDIVTNHSADIIQYRECVDKPCQYRNTNDFPQKGYTAFIPKGEENAKTPAWTNDPQYYNNRGNSEWWGESTIKGDFSGLDDFDTSNPRVISGFIDIYGTWIDKYKIDGFRIDTFKHVDSVFWQKFIPAIKARAAKNGIKNFHIFGEVAFDNPSVGTLALYTRRDKAPAVLDFSFQGTVFGVVGKNEPTDNFTILFDSDVLYQGGYKSALTNQTFISNHDMGRLGMMLRKALPNASNEELLARVKLANAMLMMLRGSPTIYSGDEQGFTGHGNDQAAREDMFPSQVASYNDNVLLGTNATTADNNFNPSHPLYQQLKMLAQIRQSNVALKRGKQIIRKTQNGPGIFAVSRVDDLGNEIVVAFNTSDKPINENVKTNFKNKKWNDLINNGANTSDANAILQINLEPFGYAIYRAVK